MDTLFNYEVGGPEDLVAVAAGRARDRGLLHHASDAWRIDRERPFDALASVAKASNLDGSGHGQVLIDPDDAIAIVFLNHGSLRIQASASQADRALELVDEVRSLLPPQVRTAEDPRASVTFWSYGSHGPMSVHRLIDAPRWEEIRDNYAGEARDSVGGLIKRSTWDESEGQLILWQGEPGTGKTYALRALAREWAGFCDFHYIIDPDRFFGANTDYMLEVILSDVGGPPVVDDDDGLDLSSSPRRAKPKPRERWKLLILEDAGELLAKDARQQVGSALSRLLNAVDGMLGQGLRLLVLVTTNEELKQLHPAIRRSGRAAERVTFAALDVDAAREWLKEHGDGSVSVDRAITLADLFARLRDPDVVVEEATGPRRAGFG